MKNSDVTKLYPLLSKTGNKMRTVGEIALLAAVLGITIVKDVFSLRSSKRDVPEKSTKGNIVSHVLPLAP